MEISEARDADVMYAEPKGPWGRRLPKGELVIVQGMPDAGKSTALRDLLARASTGRQMPGSTSDRELTPRSVVWIASEEPVKRLQAYFKCAGGDVGRLKIVRGYNRREDFHNLSEYIRAEKPRYIVCDPIENLFVSSDELASTFKVRKVLGPWFDLVQEVGATLIMVRHLNQKTDLPAMFRGVGSVGIDAFARVAFLVGKNPNEPDEDSSFVVTTYKYNIGTKPPAFPFRVVGSELNDQVGVVEWLEEDPSIKKDHVLAAELGSPKSATATTRVRKVDDAIQLLVSMLSGGECTTKEVEEAAFGRSIGKGTLEAARKVLRVQSRRVGGRGGYFVLSLPGQVLNSPKTVKDQTPPNSRAHTTKQLRSYEDGEVRSKRSRSKRTKGSGSRRPHPASVPVEALPPLRENSGSDGLRRPSDTDVGRNDKRTLGQSQGRTRGVSQEASSRKATKKKPLTKAGLIGILGRDPFPPID